MRRWKRILIAPSLLPILAACAAGTVSITKADTTDKARVEACRSLFGTGAWTVDDTTDGFFCTDLAHGLVFAVSLGDGWKGLSDNVVYGRDGVSIYYVTEDGEELARAAVDRLER
nr:hypothetical protein [Propionicimonas sp.]